MNGVVSHIVFLVYRVIVDVRVFVFVRLYDGCCLLAC